MFLSNAEDENKIRRKERCCRPYIDSCSKGCHCIAHHTKMNDCFRMKDVVKRGESKKDMVFAIAKAKEEQLIQSLFHILRITHTKHSSSNLFQSLAP